MEEWQFFKTDIFHWVQEQLANEENFVLETKVVGLIYFSGYVHVRQCGDGGFGVTCC